MKTAPVKSLDTTTKKLLAVFFIVGSIIFLVTIVRLVRTVEGSQTVAAASNAGSVRSGVDDQDNSLGLDRKPVIGFKRLPLNPAPTRPEAAQEIYLPTEYSHREAVRRQCEYLRDMSRKYPKSSLALPPEKIDEMERNGVLVN